jgi:Na+/melibiose symporter-like transporter
MGMRAALVGDIMPAAHLVGAMSMQRTTSDSARIAGALAGAGLVATLGMGAAYVVISALYATSLLLTLLVARMGPARRPRVDAAAIAPSRSPWRDLKDAADYVWNTPQLLATMCLAFLVNLTAYPMTSGLMPYVAKEIYGTDQTGLGYLVAGFATGALAGSIALSRLGEVIRPARMMLVFCALWHVMLLVFVQMQSLHAGILALMGAGFAQSLGMVPMSALLLRSTKLQFRGRVMGLRILAIYGLPLGLMISGPMIAGYGYHVTATLYCVTGLALTVAIALRWRRHLWNAGAGPTSVRTR